MPLTAPAFYLQKLGCQTQKSKQYVTWNLSFNLVINSVDTRKISNTHLKRGKINIDFKKFVKKLLFFHFKITRFHNIRKRHTIYIFPQILLFYDRSIEFFSPTTAVMIWSHMCILFQATNFIYNNFSPVFKILQPPLPPFTLTSHFQTY